ncbi:MAG: LysR family transcriptional regulator [Rhodospirillaceae bacterium]
MELRHIRYFLAVAEEHNFTRAALRVGIGQPPLSQQIRDLEREIGAPLFYRRAHGAELTEAGHAFLEEVKSILPQTEQAKTAARRAARGEIGRLRVSFTGSASFHPRVSRLIRQFRRGYPSVELTLIEANTEQQIDLLGKGGMDAGFVRTAQDSLDGLRLLRFSDEPMVMVVPSAHPLAVRQSIPLSALHAEPFILCPREVGLDLYDEVIRHCRASGFVPHVVQEAPQMASVVNLVATELGVSIVPSSMAQVHVEGVTYVPFCGAAPVAHLALATRRGERSVAVRNFLSLAQADV